MFNSSIKLLPTKRFNEYNTKINITHINFIKLLIETRRIKWKKRRWLTRFKTSKNNGEEVSEGCGSGCTRPKPVGREQKPAASAAANWRHTAWLSTAWPLFGEEVTAAMTGGAAGCCGRMVA